MSLEEARNVIQEEIDRRRGEVMEINQRIASGDGDMYMVEQRTCELYAADILHAVLGKIGMMEMMRNG